MSEEQTAEPPVPQDSAEICDAALTEDKPRLAELMGEMSELERWRAGIEQSERFKDDSPLVQACSYETRLAVACWVMRHVWAHARFGGTFRWLIYHRLGFGPDAYAPMMYADALNISNEFTVMSATEEDRTLANAIAAAADALPVESPERRALYSACFRFEELMASNRYAVTIIEKQRGELLGQGLPA